MPMQETDHDSGQFNQPPTQVRHSADPAATSLGLKRINNLTSVTWAIGEFQQWSRHRTQQNAWRPGEDDISTYLSLVDDWLRREFDIRSDTLLDRFLQPAAKRAGITKWVGFHTFRHAHSTLLKANGEDVKVVQELMRHANISTTMNIYTKALTPAKREAQSRVVDVLMDRSRNVLESTAEDAA
jgi:hypothetical protein